MAARLALCGLGPAGPGGHGRPCDCRRLEGSFGSPPLCAARLTPGVSNNGLWRMPLHQITSGVPFSQCCGTKLRGVFAEGTSGGLSRCPRRHHRVPTGFPMRSGGGWPLCGRHPPPIATGSLAGGDTEAFLQAFPLDAEGNSDFNQAALAFIPNKLPQRQGELEYFAPADVRPPLDRQH